MTRAFRFAGALAMVALAASAHAGQTYTVKVVDRQDSSTSYTYVVPGYSSSNSTANANCTAYSNAANCSGSLTTTTTGTASYGGSYEVRGATLSLQLPDLRIAVVNCSSKFDWGFEPGTRRSCRIPLVNSFQAEFDGDKAKLKWSVSIDGKKVQSETYKIIAVLEPSAAAVKEVHGKLIENAFRARHPEATADDVREVVELGTSLTVPVDPGSTWEQFAEKVYGLVRMNRVERAFKARHPELTPELEAQVVALGNSGEVVPQAAETPDAYLERLYAMVLARRTLN